MTCPTCRGTNVVDINLSLQRADVTMHSCSGCESRWWDSHGEPVALGQVLTLAR